MGRDKLAEACFSSAYATLTSWSCERRVVAKAEHLADKANPRFVVTSLLADAFSARTVYERLYCARGNMENTIKEQQLDLFSDRTSATCFAANQLRLLFSAIRQALHGTQLARATAGTLRLKFLKIGARVMVSVRRVKVAMDSAHPSAAAFARGPRSITGVGSPAAPEHLLHPTFTGDHCVLEPIKASSARRSLRLSPRKHPPGAPLLPTPTPLTNLPQLPTLPSRAPELTRVRNPGYRP